MEISWNRIIMCTTLTVIVICVAAMPYVHELEQEAMERQAGIERAEWETFAVSHRCHPAFEGRGEQSTIVLGDAHAGLVLHPHQMLYLCRDGMSVIRPRGIDS